MPFPDPEPGLAYTSPIDWHPDPIEIVHGPSAAFLGSTTTDCYHPSTVFGGVARATPVVPWGSSHGNARFSRDFGGTYPQDEGGLDCAWTWVREGYSNGSDLWSGSCPTHTGTPSPGAINGAGYHGASDAMGGPLDPSAVEASAHIAGYTLRPSDFFHNWTSPLLDTADGSVDTAVAADFDAAFAAYQPTPDSFLQWEYPYPVFVGFQIAPDERIPGVGYSPDGTVYWTVDASGWAMTVPDPDVEDIAWAGPGEPDAILLTDYLSPDSAAYSGGESTWLDPDPDWIPEWDPATGTFTEAPVIPFNVYHEFHAKLIPSGDPTIPPRVVLNDASTMPDGFSVSVGGSRDLSILAVKALWKPPRFRFVTESTTIPPRRIFQRNDGATHGAKRVLGGRNTRQSGSRTLGSVL